MIKQIKSFFLGSPEKKSGSCSVSTGGETQLILQDNDFISYAYGYGEGLYKRMSASEAMGFYRSSGAVATAVDIISQEASRISPVLEMPDGSLNDTHEILDLLQNPNDWNESYQYFIGAIAKSKLLTGNYYIYGGGLINRPPVEMYNIKPQLINVSIQGSDDRPHTFRVYQGDAPGSYKRTRMPSGYRFYDGQMKELFHGMGYSSDVDNLSGDSPLVSICIDIHSLLKGRLHNVKLLENGGRPSLWVNFKDTVTQDQLNERREIINEQVAGSDNAGKIIVSGGSDYSINELGTSNKDMDYANLERAAEQCVYKRFRIPLPIVSNDAATFNNMETAVYQLYDFAVLPLSDDIFSSLSMFLLPRYGLDPSTHRITYNQENIPAIRNRMIEELKVRKEIGIETINELRQSIPGRGDVVGGDEVYISATQVPVGGQEL